MSLIANLYALFVNVYSKKSASKPKPETFYPFWLKGAIKKNRITGGANIMREFMKIFPPKPEQRQELERRLNG